MQLSTEWTTGQDMEDESQMRADRRSEFDLSESRVKDEHSSARTALDAGDCSTNVLGNFSILTGATDANPVNEVVQLLSDLETKIQEAWRPHNFTRVLWLV